MNDSMNIADHLNINGSAREPVQEKKTKPSLPNMMIDSKDNTDFINEMETPGVKEELDGPMSKLKLAKYHSNNKLDLPLGKKDEIERINDSSARVKKEFKEKKFRMSKGVSMVENIDRLRLNKINSNIQNMKDT